MSASDSTQGVSCLLTFRGMEKIKLKCKLGIPTEESGLQSAIPPFASRAKVTNCCKHCTSYVFASWDLDCHLRKAGDQGWHTYCIHILAQPRGRLFSQDECFYFCAFRLRPSFFSAVNYAK